MFTAGHVGLCLAQGQGFVGKSIGGALRSRISVLGWVHFVALVCASVAVLLSFGGRNSKPRTVPTPSVAGAASHEQAEFTNSGDVSSSLKLVRRPVYPYSVIPGGVESAQELKNAVLRDSVVAGHYAGFRSREGANRFACKATARCTFPIGSAIAFSGPRRR